MGESRISDIELTQSKDAYSSEENIEINVRFSIEGGLRDAFNEANWTKAYNGNDISFKMKYVVFRKKLKKSFPDAPAASGKATESLITFVKDRPGHDWRYAIDATKSGNELQYEPVESF